MLFQAGCILAIVLITFMLKKKGIRQPFSKGIALALGFSLLAVACLGQNYTQSLIPEVNDGIGISNPVAYWIIGEVRWTHELFKKTFEQYIYITLLLLAAYPIVRVAENKHE
ncbi:hypothetical protein SY83_04290 [Paenibacillus swuensis]|uniref:Uncharacterized protein n=1 Tax=Paenibacillus swuensis TaxID=1178515 RepID=A0A172TFJ0_9BACL|nr:hypothetical protein [Paenibacillus swuensis]ANE45647.1 hypothetical protein SY83_04290 [Paenibacillus swuensis]